MSFDHNDALDRLWAATRPEEPSAASFDRLWAQVCARDSEPRALAFATARPWRRWGLALAVAAQAAALLVAGFVALNRPEPIQVARGPEVALPHAGEVLLLAVGTTGFLTLGADGVMVEFEVRPEMPGSETDVVAIESDVLNFMESYE